MDRAFTGGDGLEGIEQLYHRIMMKNELYNGRGAYRLSWAGNSHSGLTIGGNQLDLAYCDEAIIEELAQIIAKKIGVSQLFVEHALRKKGAPPEVVFKYDHQEIQELLASEPVVEYLDELYRREMHRRSRKVEKVVDAIDCRVKRRFYASALGRCLLFDYDNQFNISPQGKFVKMLAKEHNLYSYRDHVEFLLKLRYGKLNPKDVMRRLKNILHVVYGERLEKL